MDNRVIAQVQVHAARAAQEVAKLEAAEKTVPLLSGTSATRLHLSRRIKAARELSTSWETVLDLVRSETEAQRRETELGQRIGKGLVP